MRIVKGNIWDYWHAHSSIVIPTNGFVKKDGACVMGAGLAKQAKERVHSIEYILGSSIREKGNNVYLLPQHLISFPVKSVWYLSAELELIEESSKQLAKIHEQLLRAGKGAFIYLPKVGCGNGKLSWEDVEPILDKHLDNFYCRVVDFK